MGSISEQINRVDQKINSGTENFSEDFLKKPVSRRRVLQGALKAGGTLLAADLFLAACGGATPTETPALHSLNPDKTSGEISSSFAPETARPVAVDITTDLFTKPFENVSDSATFNIGGQKTAIKDILSASSSMWNEQLSNAFSLSGDPVTELIFTLSAVEMSKQTGTVDLSEMFPGLDLKLARFNLNSLPGDQSSLVIKDAKPQNMTIQKGANMTLLGLFGNEAVVAFDDTTRTKDKSPKMYLASIPLLSQGQTEGTSLQDILARVGGSYDDKAQEILFKDGSTLTPGRVDSNFMTLIGQTEGSFFLNTDPLRTKVQGKPVPEANPVIAELPSQFSNDKIVQLKDGRIAAEDSSGKVVARARYDYGQSSWIWATDKESLADYTLREYADAEGKTLSVFTYGPEFGDATYDSTIETVANQVVIAAELDSINVFKNFSNADWEKVLSNWSKISEDLNNGIVPGDFGYNWQDANNVIAFAQQHHMTVAAQHLLGNSDIPQTIINGNFTNSQLTELLRFMVQTKVLQYKDVIYDWEGAAEVPAILLWGTDQQKFWFNRLGNGIVDKVFEWAHQANPKAKLRFTDDGILEEDQAQREQLYMSFLKHFKQAGIPVDIASLENNMWVYNPPNEQYMLNILNQIKALGYQIISGETTVVTSDVNPWDSTTPKAVTVTNVDQAQAKVYSDIATAVLSVGGSFGIGGFTDEYEWYENNQPGSSSHPAYAMIFDSEF